MKTDIHHIVSKRVIALENEMKLVGVNKEEWCNAHLTHASECGDYIGVMAMGLILFKLNFKKD